MFVVTKMILVASPASNKFDHRHHADTQKSMQANNKRHTHRPTHSHLCMITLAYSSLTLRSLAHSLLHILTSTSLMTHLPLFGHSLSELYTHPPLSDHSLIYSLNLPLFDHLLSELYTHPPLSPITHSFTHSISNSLITHLVTYILSHPLLSLRSLIHSLTQSPTL